MLRATDSSAFCVASSSVRCRSVKRVSWMVREMRAVIAMTDSSEKKRITPSSSSVRLLTTNISATNVATYATVAMVPVKSVPEIRMPNTVARIGRK